jgi:hypothetical protein
VQMRFTLMKEEVLGARNWEAKLSADRSNGWAPRYTYPDEPFRVKLKQFWPLHELENARKHVFTHLPHENDGLILQACFLSALHPTRMQC